MNYITAERVTKYINNHLKLNPPFFSVKHFGNMITLMARDASFGNDVCILAYVDSNTEKVIINNNVEIWNEMAHEFAKVATQAIKLEKPFEKLRTNMIITTLNTYMQDIKPDFNVYLENNDICLDYYNRICATNDRFATFVNMDPAGYKEGTQAYYPKDIVMFQTKYNELLEKCC